MTARPIIAIDGPAAAGKGTLARRIAAELGLPYLDTGLLYRAVGRRVLDAGGDPADAVVAEAAARALVPADLERTDLRGPEADAAAADVAAIPAVRAALLAFQRGFGAEHGAVLDGRDIGTVIFPDAGVKLFVTASLEERARRRWRELQAKGVPADLATVEEDMRARDAQDAARAAAPLRPAKDAVVLDTTALDADAAFQAAMQVVRAKLGNEANSSPSPQPWSASRPKPTRGGGGVCLATLIGPDEFAALMAGLGPFEPAPRLAAGVSGGADSMALALLADIWVRAHGGSLLALVVDHGLRPESAAEAALTIERLTGCGIPTRPLRLTDLQRGPALAERARAARYAALRAACAEAGILHLLLGHHAADQAETVLMRRQSGSGPAGLAAMPVLAEQCELRLLRPLLGVPPVRLRATLRAAGVAWVEDPSNRDQRALRTRLRAALDDPDGTGPAIAVLCEAARTAGAARAQQEATTARVLAERAALYPEGFALLSPGSIDPAALAALLQAIGGAAFPPPTSSVARLAAAPRPATLAGIRLLPAGRLGDGLLLVREATALAPPVAATPGAVWDGRFRMTSEAAPPEDATIGALGADAARLRRHSPLPAAVLRTLPAVRRSNFLVAVPHLLYPDRAACAALSLVFSPRRPAAGAPFLPVREPGGNMS